MSEEMDFSQLDEDEKEELILWMMTHCDDEGPFCINAKERREWTPEEVAAEIRLGTKMAPQFLRALFLLRRSDELDIESSAKD